MSLNMTEGVGRTEFQTVSPGSYAGVFIKVIDCGTAYDEKWDKKKSTVYIQLELNEFMEDGRPFVIGRSYSASFNEKSTLRKDLEAARGQSFTADELRGLDLKSILGKQTLVSVIAGKDGKSYLGGFAKLPKGMVAPEIQNPLISFDMSDWDEETFGKLGKGLQARIQLSDEWKSRQAKGGAAPPAEPVKQDEIPW